jgi:hypothetical protein
MAGWGGGKKGKASTLYSNVGAGWLSKAGGFRGKLFADDQPGRSWGGAGIGASKELPRSLYCVCDDTTCTARYDLCNVKAVNYHVRQCDPNATNLRIIPTHPAPTYLNILASSIQLRSTPTNSVL